MKLYNYRKKRRKTKMFLFFVLIMILFWWFENCTFKVVRTEISCDKISSPVKIVILSDLHTNKYGKDNKHLYNVVKDENPDLIFVLGDMYTYDNDKSRLDAEKIISSLTEITTVYFVPGEHDNNDEYMRNLSENGVNLLLYESEDISMNGNELTVYGIDNVYFGPNFDLENEFEINDSHFNILLAHIPNEAAYEAFGADLAFCGDTHGGIIQLPFVGPLIFNSEWFPKLKGGSSPITDKGLFEFNGFKMYVSPGLGNYPYPVRFFNRPELSVVTLT